MRVFAAFFVLLFLLVPARGTNPQTGFAPGPSLKPDRVLLVASVQVRDDAVIHSAWDAGDLAALLKLWGVPFDILRLDVHVLAPSDFLDDRGRPRYGAILWTARGQTDHPRIRQDYGIAASAAARLHIGFIAVGNKIQEPRIQELLGLRYLGFSDFHQPVAVTGTPHFITRGLENNSAPAEESFGEGGPRVRIASPGVETLAAAGDWPQMTARTLDPESRTRVVWIGGDPDLVFHASPLFILALRRSLVWVMGYGFYKDYEKTVVLRMDDPGSSQSAYFKGWDYAQLDEASIRRDILAPLRARRAKLGVAFCPGYPWIPDRTIRHSTSLDFVDSRGVRQNMISTRLGLLAGLKENVFDIVSHGLTHMAPDLDTPPLGGKSWWSGSWTDEWPDENWYREFRDQRRGRDLDAATQLDRLLRSAAWIEEDFGLRPLAFIPGGHAISGDDFVEGAAREEKSGGETKIVYTPPRVASNYTYKLAAEAGYGLALDLGAHYLEPDRVISLGVCAAQDLPANFARHVPGVRYFHDKDVRQNPRFLAELLDSIDADASFLGLDEWVGYLHARLDARVPAAGGIELRVENDPSFGRYFAAHSSSWTLHLTDELREELNRLGPLRLLIDGLAAPDRSLAPPFSEIQRLTFPGGAGHHVLCWVRSGVR